MSAASALIAEAATMGCRLEARDGDKHRTLWGARLDLLPGELRARLRAHRDEVLALLGEVHDDERPAASPPLPEAGTPERVRFDAAQDRAVHGLMLASHAHTCRTCGGWACYGFGLPGKAPAAWFCPAHHLDGEAVLQGHATSPSRATHRDAAGHCREQ